MIMFNDEEPSDDDPYIISGFMALQMAIESSFVDMWRDQEKPIVAKQLILGRFPFYKINFLIMPSVTRPNVSVIYYMTVVAFLLLPIATLQKIIHDKKTGFRELMRMMNISITVLYIGWIYYLMIVAIPVTIVTTALLYPVYSNSNPATIAIFILTYITMTSCFMFMIGTFFNQAIKALITSLLLWLLLAHLTIVLDQFLANSSIYAKILSLALPHSGLLYGIITFTSSGQIGELSSRKLARLQMEAKTRKNFEYHDVYNIISAKDKISIGIILTSWAVHIIIWSLLTVYMDNINPGRFGSAKPCYYPCKKGKKVLQDFDTTLRGTTNWSAVEQTSSKIIPSIRVKKVTKKFGRLSEKIVAVNEMSIDFYHGEFNVLLGHNGAGKSSLLKMIIGTYKPNRGQVYIEGRDYNLDEESDGHLIGYCPQENILVNYLTIVQHLYMFGMMKGMSYKNANVAALDLLDQLGLTAVKDSKTKNFSFGIQRRVCLAMALIGGAKILILDEPTYGIDPEYRRQVWDILSSIKKNKTIIMATNSMEAADILADRIAIIANGRIECYGTKMYLNRRYGIGFVLSIVIQEDCDLDNLHIEIQQYSSQPVKLRSTMGLVVRFDLARGTRMTKLLQFLEHNKEELQINSLAVNAASIEGQFLRIGLASQYRERRVYLPFDKYEGITQKRRRDLLHSEKTWERLNGRILWRQQVLTMFYKKFLHLLSSWKLYVFSIFLSFIACALTMMISELGTLFIFRTAEMHMNVTKYTANNYRMLYYAANTGNTKTFLHSLYTTGQTYNKLGNFHISKNITSSDLMIHPNLHSIEFRDRYFIAVDIMKKARVDLMYSSTAVHSGPIAINLLHNALLHYYTGSSNVKIKLNSQPIVDPRLWQHRLVHPRSIRNWENVAIAVSLLLIIPTIDMVTKEVKSVSKVLQLNTVGMTTLLYWMPIYIVDIVLYAISLLVTSLMGLLTYSSAIRITGIEFVQGFMIFLCYGVAAIPIGYLIQVFSRRTNTVYMILILMNLVIVLLINASVTLPLLVHLLGSTGKLILEIILHAFPPYVLSCIISNYITLSLYNKQCKIHNACGTDLGLEDPCCQNCKNQSCYQPLSVIFTKQSGVNYFHSIAEDILILISQAFLFNLLREIFEDKNRMKWYKMFSNDAQVIDQRVQPEILIEKEKVDKLMKVYEMENCLPGNIALVVQNLSKKYENVTVVRGINFTIKKQECFGLLGANSSGKSTIFKMLTGQSRINTGRAVIRDWELTRDHDKFIGMTGYCPQIGGLNLFLTGRQNLEMFAALRGIPFRNIAEEVNKWLDIFDLLDFENMKIESCPWGVRRKICILQCLIGDLPIILLDEPSSGIDIMTRHALCDTLHQMREMGRSLLVTTHNMEEAEALCLRVGILVDGQFIALDSCESLKQKHGSNFTLRIRLHTEFKQETLDAVMKTIEEAFPKIVFKDRHLAILKYELPSDIPYSNVFEKIEKIRIRHATVMDFSLNQPMMEQVFLALMKERNEKMIDDERKNVLSRLWKILLSRMAFFRTIYTL
ncbi:ATP-binding cassette sub-family A member 3 isoform X2 [Cephus cinctus]|nr:ATP-binding cassette sub-family A member 3 isoform X2 [Cephus cinctus]